MPTLQLWAGLLAAGCRRLLGRVWGGKRWAALPASPRPLALQHRWCWTMLWSSVILLQVSQHTVFWGGFSQPGSAPQFTSQCCAMQEGSTHCTGSSASRHTATCFPGKWGRLQCESPEISCERGDAGRITALGSFHVCKCVCSSATRETTTQLFFHVLLPFLACSLEGCGCYPCFVTCLKIRSSQQRCC